MTPSITFARRVYFGAAVYGILALLPNYFLEARVGRDFPPAITHPEYFYGFIGVALAWQLVFLAMAKDPLRFRALMPVSILEKLSFGLPALGLFLRGRTNAAVLGFGLIDLTLGALFLTAYLRTRQAQA
ncbi:MAG TPA: hypothetical protein VJ570_09870 [Holophagaceae bacterium]|nr:hypothetical protein [Holophagaceae bacterium]